MRAGTPASCGCCDKAKTACSFTSPSRSPSSTRSGTTSTGTRSEEHTSELQSPCNLVCRLLLEKKQHLASRTVAVDFSFAQHHQPGNEQCRTFAVWRPGTSRLAPPGVPLHHMPDTLTRLLADE